MLYFLCILLLCFFFKQKTAYKLRISDWSSDVCSSDLHGIAMVNAPGTVDSDYRGELQVLLINLGSEPFTVARGDRIAQMVVAPVARVAWQETGALDETARGAGGFGSTGGFRPSGV